MEHSKQNHSRIIINYNYDEGLRRYMMRVYGYMSGALAVTAVASILVVTSETITNIIYIVLGDEVIGLSAFGWFLSVVPIIIALTFIGLRSISHVLAQILFWSYSVTLGLSLSSLLFLYTGESVVRIFLIATAVFGCMSIYGYSTKKDLTDLGAFLFMGLIGIMVALIVNIVLKSTGLEFGLSIISVFIFVGLTVYDTQKIKDIYLKGWDTGGALGGKLAIIGALNLYLDFINIFVHLLRLFGERREK